ncbi:MAG: 50S ribosomal protein L11 methyltransferase [Bacteroidota bacterium]
MKYIEFNFTITPKETGNEILAAMLADIGFESFIETDMGLLAYISTSKFSSGDVEKLGILHNKEFSVKYEYKSIPDKNWNEEWESSYSPVAVAGKCCVRAPFHPANTHCKYDIIIEPKMSFGTAHHETTHLMIEQLLQMDVTGKSVLDMGCGTSVLAILAAKMGASTVTAIDIDEWAFNNSVENIASNLVNDIVRIFQGDAGLISETHDVILANINRNILMRDIPKYISHLNKAGILLLSGFYDADVPVISDRVESDGMKFISKKNKNNWIVLKFKKQ